MGLTNPAAKVTRVLLSGGLPDFTVDYPFMPGMTALAKTAGTSNIYCLSLPGDQSANRFTHKLAANLGAAEIDITIPSHILAASVDSASLDAAVDPTVLTTPGASTGINVLRAVIIRDASGLCLRRRGNDVADGALSAESFKVKSATALRLRGPASGSWKAGETFTVILVPQATIVGFGGLALGTQMNANRTYEDVSYPIMWGVIAANEEINVTAIPAA